jgi:hypothetical protein
VFADYLLPTSQRIKEGVFGSASSAPRSIRDAGLFARAVLIGSTTRLGGASIHALGLATSDPRASASAPAAIVFTLPTLGAITGGTGAYKDVVGQQEVRELPPAADAGGECAPLLLRVQLDAIDTSSSANYN